jgi:hypothetical protein
MECIHAAWFVAEWQKSQSLSAAGPCFENIEEECMMRNRPTRLFPVFLLALTLLFSGCGKTDVQIVRTDDTESIQFSPDSLQENAIKVYVIEFPGSHRQAALLVEDAYEADQINYESTNAHIVYAGEEHIRGAQVGIELVTMQYEEQLQLIVVGVGKTVSEEDVYTLLAQQGYMTEY